MNVKKLIVLIVLLCWVAGPAIAQSSPGDSRGTTVTVKTNLPYWGTATFNAGLEFRLARHWTFDVEAGLNAFDDKKEDGSYGRTLKHVRVHPELRYWFCESFYKHFIGLHVPFIAYNFADVKVLDLEKDIRKNKKEITEVYRQALPYMEKYRALAPDEKKKWAPALYRIYLNLNMGKQFEEIDRIINI